MPTILLSGYYGYNNIGDEAVLGGILAGLRAEAPEVTAMVLSADPAGTRALHGVEAIPRMRLAQIRHALNTTDLFISGGAACCRMSPACARRSITWGCSGWRSARVCRR